jgi:AcrR family transcriptional regulator
MSNSAMSVSTPGRVTSGRSYGGLTPEDRVAARRARFIETGIELFGSQGFRAATVRGVCAAAGLTDRYFYESFDSLEALLQACYSALMARLRDGLVALRARAWPDTSAGMEAQLTAAYEVWFDLVREPAFARIVLSEVLGVSPAVDALYEGGMREFSELNTGAVAQALQRAGLSPQRRLLIGRALVGAAVQVARTWAAEGCKMPRAQVVRTCVLVAMGTVRAVQEDADRA